MAQALAGSQSAFEQILRRYQRPVISLLIRLTGDAALAEDLAQEAFVKAFRNLAAFDSRRRLSSWLFRIAHNTGIDALRKARPVDRRDRCRRADGPADRAGRRRPGRAPGTGPGDRSARWRSCGPDQRTAVVLRYEQGLSFEEIGQVLGIPEATARSHVHRARKDLMRLMTAAGWAPGR